MNASRSSDSIGFQRFSKPIVLDGLPLSPAPHSEPEKWPGKDLDVVGQREQLPVNALVEAAPAFSRARPGQIGSADGADKQRVAGQHEPRIGAALADP